MSLHSPEHDNADGYDDADDTPATCHFCDQFVNDDPREYEWHGGWLYHTGCVPADVQADRERASRADIARDDFNITRR